VTRTLLCDLDDTLFDHSGATRDALAVVRASAPAFHAWTLEQFDRHHRVILETLHLQVLAGRWTVEEARVERFRQLLAAVGRRVAGGRIG
jgi:putative hydrolase of the HAD superfamily